MDGLATNIYLSLLIICWILARKELSVFIMPKSDLIHERKSKYCQHIYHNYFHMNGSISQCFFINCMNRTQRLVAMKIHYTDECAASSLPFEGQQQVIKVHCGKLMVV